MPFVFRCHYCLADAAMPLMLPFRHCFRHAAFIDTLIILSLLPFA
jgi:hypothetical protein